MMKPIERLSMKSILKKIKTVHDRLSRLKELFLKIRSFEEYIASKENIDIAERNIHVAIESCLDIGKIIKKEERVRLDILTFAQGLFLLF